jgi:hypothetical protein
MSNWRTMMLIPAWRVCGNKTSTNSLRVVFFVKYLNEVFIVIFHHTVEDMSKAIKNWQFRVRAQMGEARAGQPISWWWLMVIGTL